MSRPGPDAVFGNYSSQNNVYLPVETGSSPLFKALVQDDADKVKAFISPAREEELTKLHLVLHWERSGGNLNSGHSNESHIGDLGVSLKSRSLLHLASYQTALTGKDKVLSLLLALGADPNQRAPEGFDSFSVAANGNLPFMCGVLEALRSSPASCSEQPENVQSGRDSGPESSSRDVMPGINDTVDNLNDDPGFSSLSEPPKFSGFLAEPGKTVFGDDNQPFLTSQTFLTDSLRSHTDHESPRADGYVQSAPLPVVNRDDHKEPRSFDDITNLCMSELTLPEYTTDEFRMFGFKVFRCNKRNAHDWRTCPFAHPTENARRRDPREFTYCGVPCPDYKQGLCVRGDACPYAHGVFECWLHPTRYHTQLCKDGSHCRRSICFFAHSVSQLRAPSMLMNDAGNPAASTDSVAPSSHVSKRGAGDVTVDGASNGDSGKGAANSAAAVNRGSLQDARLTAPASEPNMMALSSQAKALAGTSSTQLAGGSAPRMSNAFARRHGLNPKANSKVNLQKLTVQAKIEEMQSAGEAIQNKKASVNLDPPSNYTSVPAQRVLGLQQGSHDLQLGPGLEHLGVHVAVHPSMGLANGHMLQQPGLNLQVLGNSLPQGSIVPSNGMAGNGYEQHLNLLPLNTSMGGNMVSFGGIGSMGEAVLSPQGDDLDSILGKGAHAVINSGGLGQCFSMSSDSLGGATGVLPRSGPAGTASMAMSTGAPISTPMSSHQPWQQSSQAPMSLPFVMQPGRGAGSIAHDPIDNTIATLQQQLALLTMHKQSGNGTESHLGMNINLS